MTDPSTLLDQMTSAIHSSLRAGEKILQVYGTDFSVDLKDDQSPLTLADQKAHQEIVLGLKETGLPILSEEGREIPYEERSQWGLFWMVDPLDGTKEFVKRNGEFTVNIALIDRNQPIGGVIYVPVTRRLFFGASQLGAFRIDGVDQQETGTFTQLSQRAQELPLPDKGEVFTVVGSRSHMSPETEKFIQELKEQHGTVEITSMGSSLKICLVAEGAAQIYPRFAPTMEWDTAAGQAIAQAAGKSVIDWTTKRTMTYNKENLLNPWFLVR